MSEILRRAEALHLDVPQFVLGSLDGEGFPNAKVMLPAKHRESLREIYFSTNTSSRHVQQFRAESRACVYFYDALHFVGVMLRGHVEVLEDAETKAHFWRAGDDLYYPKGMNDPDYCILRFSAMDGRFYEGFHSEDFTLSVENLQENGK